MYYSEYNPTVEFKIPDGSKTLATLKKMLNDLLSDSDNIRVIKVEFQEDWIDINGMVKYNLIELKNDADAKYNLTGRRTSTSP